MKHFLLLTLFFIFSIEIFAQDFPIGIYCSQYSIPPNDMDYIKQLKVDYIINSVNNNLNYLNSSYPNFIASDHWDITKDFVQFYSHAYYAVWEAEDTVAGIIPGYKLKNAGGIINK